MTVQKEIENELKKAFQLKQRNGKTSITVAGKTVALPNLGRSGGDRVTGVF